MAYKIAIASTDGKVVNQHFGRAEYFYIGEVNDREEFRYLEERKLTPVCQGKEHEAEVLYNIAERLADCRYILVSQIGPSAEYVLNKKGITVLTIRHYIDSAVNKLMEYDKRINFIYQQK
ncbi:NifB/NifX family molybdenum-iron cluster-binding protein [Anaerocolumna sp. AGMB13020]|uniref:NifB/NifX family molybdenum-iron cluster-binding protein n=1 Tax=Anaerocolumna sp. AGMB13020 TaxID=3081750 RepID=UPI00295405EE|nr:NifB/NifX family molybdenum-iron cluster-binding protein [Anaerocolumna sp. AGMB13020]WOO37462.1 NifB/NifX family molybdenum-iron cluster-binding protein [Anaerocolumna sp. AGMB13020]